MAPVRLRVVIFPESVRAWTARSLEHDIAAGGTTAEAALDTLLRIVQAHAAFDLRHGRPPLSAFAAAPALYWSAFSRAERDALRLELPYRVDTPAIQVLAATAPHHPILSRVPVPALIA
jgi:hypothetical protein